jgi:hypothetical protein
MKRASINTQLWILTALAMMLVPRVARGDGGIVHLRETRGPFSVTVFVSPEVVSGGLTDVSVLVQSQKNGDVVLDADVNLSLIPPEGVAMNESDPFCGPSGGTVFQSANATPDSLTVRATRDQASNKLLYAALLRLDAAGNWKLHVAVSHNSDSADFDCLLPVTTPSARLSGLWPYLAFPPIAIAAFALNQKLRRKSLERGVDPGNLPINRPRHGSKRWMLDDSAAARIDKLQSESIPQ